MKYTITLFFLLSHFLMSYSQVESHKWLLPNNNIIDFEDEIIVSDYVEDINPQFEGSAVVMNSLGDILFTATSTTIYDSNWNPIINGENLDGSPTGHTAQSPVILQRPGFETQYYVFYNQDHYDTKTVGDLKYSIIDICDENKEMSILEEQKNITIEGDFSERLNIVEIDKSNYWLLATKLHERKLFAYRINQEGIYSTPIISEIDNSFDGQIGKIKVNGNKNKLAWSSTFSITAGLSIYDFDINTGKISNRNIISNSEIYGIEWSPTDQFLYYTYIYIGSGVYSYSINDESNTEMFHMPGDYHVGDLKLSPKKDRIIVSQRHNNKLSQITDLENGGIYSELDLGFMGDLDLLTGLQEQVINYGLDIPLIEFTIENLTINEEEDFTQLNLIDEFTEITWSDGQTGNSASFSEAGIYQVEAYYKCQKVNKEFEIIAFELECDHSFDASNIENDLLIKIDFLDPINNSSDNGLNILNSNVLVEHDRFEDYSAGSFSEDRYLNLGNQELLKPNFPMSFSFWVMQTETGIDRNYIYTSDLQLDKRAGFAIAFGASDNKLSFFYSDENGCYNPSCRRQITSVDPIESGEWMHLSIVIRGHDDADFFVNGCLIPVNYSGSGALDLHYTDKPSYIGFADNSNVFDSQRAFFSGKIDDFYFWNRSITEEEVLYLYDRFEVQELELQETYTILNGQDDITIDLPIDYTDVLWSDGQTGNTGNFSNEGTYQVEAFYNCHLVCKEFEIAIISNTEFTGSLGSSYLLYPNPTNSFISFDIEDGNVLPFRLTSAKGEDIDAEFESDQNKITLNISHLPNGVYFLTRVIDNQQITQKFIKIK